jgi:hypothetical protein
MLIATRLALLAAQAAANCCVLHLLAPQLLPLQLCHRTRKQQQQQPLKALQQQHL